jgi:hypothetical protein
VRYLRNNQEYLRRGSRIRLADRRRDGGHCMSAASPIALHQARHHLIP